jgi:hypothetical protein
MPIRPTCLRALQFVCFTLLLSLLLWMPAASQTKPDPLNYSGMYGFLREGEFVQLTVEDGGHVIGFVSRYADPEGDSGFLDHFFKSAKLDGNQLAFTTETVKGVSFEFHGAIERGEGKNRSEEAYYVLKGALVENTTNAAKNVSSSPHDVALKSFPLDVAPPPAQKQ